MSTRGPEPSSLGRAIADLEAIDKRLADLVATRSPDGISPPGQIEEGRTLVRAAIRALALVHARTADTPAETHAETVPDRGEDLGATKRRVKIKAESQTAPASTLPPTDTHARGRIKGASKTAPRGDNREVGLPTQAAASASERSLLARLGAAMPDTGDEPERPAAPTPVTVSETTTPAQDTAARLARLEAEIAAMAEDTPQDATAEIPATPPQAANISSPPTRGTKAGVSSISPAIISDTSAEDDSDDDDTEIVIVGGRTAAASPNTAGSRVLRESPVPSEEDAEVVIVQPEGTARTPIARSGTKSAARPTVAPGKPAAGSKWRLFRGSN